MLVQGISGPRTLDEIDVDAFAADLTGELIRPGDDRYNEARRVWNGMIDKRPAMIAQCADRNDVVRAVSFARDHGLLVAVRGGGHSIPGHSTCEGGLVIDLSPMKGISVDPERHRAHVGPGVLLGELDRATQEFGLAVPAGQISNTGVAGLTLGGGTGWLMRKLGLTIDSLQAVEIVTADGAIRRASEEENPELFWGVRGGGGNLGVVTSFEFRLHPVGPLVLAGGVFYPLERARDALRFYGEFMATAPDELTAFAVFLTAPPASPFPQHLWGRPLLTIDVCYAGPLDKAERAVAPLRAFGAPVLDLVGPLPYVVRQSMLDHTTPAGLHLANASDYLADLSEPAIDTLVDAFAGVTSPRTLIHLARMGGAIVRVRGDETAFGHRDAPYLLWITSMWDPTDDDERHMRWTRDLRTAMAPFRTGGVYVNALGDEGTARVQAAYGAVKHARLTALKMEYDPTNLFRLNQNIRPRRAD